jgi:hypothetical protein
MAGAGKLHHDQAVLKGRLRLVALERLPSDRRHQDAIEMEALDCGHSDTDVSGVRRIEAAAEERDAHRSMLNE